MILGVLLRNELLKTFKRLAFWVTYISFLGIILINLAERYVRARGDPDRPFALPDAWQRIVGDDPEVALFFGAIVLMLLVASEFSWRTARQNVIDGLSKAEWFAAKALLVPIIGVLFVGALLSVGGVLALLGTDLGAVEGSLVRGPDVFAMGGLFVAFLGVASLGFLIALAVRSAGPAIGVWFLYMGVVEQLLRSALARIGGTAGDVARYLPFAAFRQLTVFRFYDPEVQRRAVDAARQAGRSPPEPGNLGLVFGVALAWIAVFFAISYVWFRRRDL